MGQPIISLDEDMHVHSTFSDGKGTIDDNLKQALSVGLRRLCCVDHVRHDTAWVDEFVQAIRSNPRAQLLDVSIGVETKLLDSSGALDLPSELPEEVKVYVADHQFPLPGKCRPAKFVRELIAEGTATETELLWTLASAYINAMQQRSHLVLAHIFSVLPKIGIDEETVPEAILEKLALEAKRSYATIEIDERWRCPGIRTVRYFVEAGVPVVASSDAHRPMNIGVFDFVRTVAEEFSST